MSDAQTVFVVDDQEAIRKALARLLASAGLAVLLFESAQAFLDSASTDAPGCLVLDLSMPDMNGMALQHALGRCASVLPIIFLTGHGDIASGVNAMKNGAADFLTKPVDADRLIDAVRLAFDKNALARQQRSECHDIQARLATLTPREADVMRLVVEGKLNKQVAAELGTVEKTVKVHRARVMTKMGVRSVSALVRLVDRARAKA
ncbi:MAG: response regulator [Pseudomonadota bacterium]